MSHEIYLDNNATTKPLDEVRRAMAPALGDGFGNPSSSHLAGDRARRILRDCRNEIARLIGADASGIVFTSSGTEANNMTLLSPFLREGAGRCRIVTTSGEHSSVLRIVEHLAPLGVEIVLVPLGHDGVVDVEQLEGEITDHTSLVSVQWVNNETGVIQPIERIGETCHSRGVPFHIDACQAIGKLTMEVAQLPIDLVTITGHKIHAPQGVGAIYARDRKWLAPMFHGGPQEDRLRAGTENVPGIAGFGKAAQIRMQQLDAVVQQLARLRDRFEADVRCVVADVSVNGDRNRRICNTTNLCFHGVDGQALVAQLDQQGIRCSQSSACTNQRPEPSYVLRAMGLSEEDAYSSVRFSFGVHNTVEEIEPAVAAIRDICAKLRGFAAQLQNPYQTGALS